MPQPYGDPVHIGGEAHEPDSDQPSPQPGPDRDDWVDFLFWMADVNADNAAQAEAGREIVRIVEKPHKYDAYYRDYLALGGVERQVSSR